MTAPWRRLFARPRPLFLAAAAAAVLVAALWLFGPALPGGERIRLPVRPAEVAPPAVAETRAVQVAFASRAGDGTVVETRRVPVAGRLEDELLSALQLLCAGPMERGSIGVIPPGARPLSVFYDERSGAVVLDFSAELKTNHPGGSAGEQATIAGILRTVALNFPEVRSCLILIAGAQEETLAGHIGLDRPLDPRRWM